MTPRAAILGLLVLSWIAAARAQDMPIQELRAILERNQRELLRLSVLEHRRAAALRARAAAEHRPALVDEARAAERAAISGFQTWLTRFPSSIEAYETHFLLAQALVLDDRLREAARVFAIVRDSSFDDVREVEAAVGVVTSLEALARREATPSPSLAAELAAARSVCRARAGRARERCGPSR